MSLYKSRTSVRLHGNFHRTLRIEFAQFLFLFSIGLQSRTYRYCEHSADDKECREQRDDLVSGSLDLSIPQLHR